MGPHPCVPAELRQGPFTLAQAATAGLTRWHLRSRAWRRVAPGVYVWAGLAQGPLLTLRAIALRLPTGAAFSGQTAAWLHGLDVEPCAPVSVIVPLGSTLNRGAPVKVSRATLPAEEVVSCRGLPTTCSTRTIFDLCRVLALPDAVALTDAALKRRLLTWDELAAVGRRSSRHVSSLRRVLELANPRSESMMESRLRVLLVEGGLPKPEVQVVLFDDVGRILARADLYYPSHRLVIEYDGSTHRHSLIDDDQRQNRLLSARYRLLRFTAPDVLRTPNATVAQVRGILTGPSEHKRAS
jgi:very-short-patch-repair endonuclease